VIRCQGGKVEYDVTRPAKWREPEDEARQIDEQHEAIELMAELKGQDHDDIPF
jgi:hypothetical protein